MSVAKLLDDFSKRDYLPIEVKDIIKEIRARKIKDRISFFRDVELDSRAISGFLHREEGILNGKPIFVSKIHYAKEGHEKERVVCAKELLHIVDPDNHRVSSKEQVKDLISKITLPADLVDAFDGEHVWNDRLAILEAIALLFPLAARKILYSAYMNGRVSIEKVAEYAEIPVPYARMVMDGRWPSMHRKLIARRRRLELPPKGGAKKSVGKKRS